MSHIVDVHLCLCAKIKNKKKTMVLGKIELYIVGLHFPYNEPLTFCLL